MGRPTILPVIALLVGLGSGWSADSSGGWAGACAGALGNRSGAVLLVSLPEGSIVYEHNATLAGKKHAGTSIYKPLTAFALLSEGAVTEGETFRTTTEVTVQRYGITLRSPYDVPGQEIALARALAESNNGYFYIMGARLEPETLLGYYRRLGLGACVRAPTTAREKAEMPAHGGACVRASARDLVPYLVRLATDASPEMRAVRNAMELAVTDGTGKGCRIRGVAVCGKTGWLHGVGQFLAFAPKDSPEVGIVVVVPGGTGSEASAVAGKILARWPWRGGRD